MASEIRKVVLITGGSSGIGQSTAELFASKGYKVAITGQRPNRVQNAVDICANLSPNKEKPFYLILDFCDPQNGAVAVKKTIEHFGRLDILVNNAGTYIETDVNEESSYEAYRRLITINNDAAMLASLAAADELKKNRGSIVFVSSVLSKMPLIKFYGYCASKAALTMFARCLALDLAPYVRVNVCSPGPVETRFHEGLGYSGNEQFCTTFSKTTLRNRVAKPEEIASTVYFLASDEAKFINGHDMDVDDGFLIKPPVHPLPLDSV